MKQNVVLTPAFGCYLLHMYRPLAHIGVSVYVKSQLFSVSVCVYNQYRLQVSWCQSGVLCLHRVSVRFSFVNRHSSQVAGCEPGGQVSGGISFIICRSGLCLFQPAHPLRTAIYLSWDMMDNSFPGGATEFPFLSRVQTVSGTHQTFSLIYTVGCLCMSAAAGGATRVGQVWREVTYKLRYSGPPGLWGLEWGLGPQLVKIVSKSRQQRP